MVATVVFESNLCDKPGGKNFENDEQVVKPWQEQVSSVIKLQDAVR